MSVWGGGGEERRVGEVVGRGRKRGVQHYYYSLMPALGPLKKTLPVTEALPVMAW